MKIKYLALALLTVFVSVEADAQSSPPRKDIPAIVKAANGAIVTIFVKAGDTRIEGTGFIVSPDGAIVTNYHVIRTGNVAVVKFPDGTVLPVDGVLAADKDRDLAVIKIHGKTFKTLTLGNSDRVQVGEEVVAIGDSLGLELTVSNGILSGVRTVEKEGGKFLQTTAPISHGNSGGPLFNMTGEVIGINTLFFEGGENLNFAIPVNDAKDLLSDVSSKLQGLPNEPLNDDSQNSKPMPPDRRQELGWLSTERFVNPAFSALFPRRKPGDPEIYCRTEDYKSDQQKVTSTRCDGRAEGGAVEALILYSDLPFELTSDSRAEFMQYTIHSSIVDAIDISASEPTSIYQDQAFTAMPPIPALESTAKGTLDGHPAKVCVRSGGQGRRQWLLIVGFADPSGHTKKECDAFFDSVVVE